MSFFYKNPSQFYFYKLPPKIISGAQRRGAKDARHLLP